MEKDGIFYAFISYHLKYLKSVQFYISAPSTLQLQFHASEQSREPEQLGALVAKGFTIQNIKQNVISPSSTKKINEDLPLDLTEFRHSDQESYT